MSDEKLQSDQKPKSLLTKDALRNTIIIFCIVLGLFFAIEILPLHFGSSGLAWQDLWPEIKTRLPRILIVAFLAGAFIGTRKPEKK